MKKILIALIVFGFILSACSFGAESNVPANNSTANASKSGSGQDVQSTDNSGGNTLASESGQDDNSTILNPIVKEPAAQCETGIEHPIAVSIAEQYAYLTDYDEVIGWFCDGALFEDILNALTTEELSGIDAGDVLMLVAEGKSWDEIWLELGITEE